MTLVFVSKRIPLAKLLFLISLNLLLRFTKVMWMMNEIRTMPGWKLLFTNIMTKTILFTNTCYR